jgi:streptomycin 6-kinase
MGGASDSQRRDARCSKDLLAAREGRAEIDALELWAGEGAVLSYATDRAPWAVLMERCEPGTSLLRAELDVDSALDSAASLARHLTT